MSVAARNPLTGKVGRANLRNRIRLVFIFLACCYLGLAIRLYFIQVYSHSNYVAQAAEIHQHTFRYQPERGLITDRNGTPLAINVPTADVYVDPTQLPSPPEQAAELIASVFPAGTVDPVALSNRIAYEQSRTVYSAKLKKEVHVHSFKLMSSISYDLEQQLKAKMHQQRVAHAKDSNVVDCLSGITLEEHNIRDYPYGTLASQVLGFPSTNASGAFAAKYGVELSANDQLAGNPGFVKTAVDDARRVIPGTVVQEVSVKDGQTVALTIDAKIQALAEQQLQASVIAHNANSGSVVVLDPKTGDILAMASYPTFDPNNASKTAGEDQENWDDRPIHDLYEPGSTLKTLTMAAVLDSEGLDMANHRIVCNGTLKVDNRTIHCAKDSTANGRHGVEDMEDVLRNSCNIGASLFSFTLGPQKLYKYEKLFGLFDDTQCGLPYASVSDLCDPDVQRWSQLQLATVSFGQGVSLTALQLAGVYATIANNGVRVYPHILLNQKFTEKPYQVVKPEVAALVLKMLRAVVTNGTGASAQIANYTIGGKTGSAQVANGRHGYSGEYIGSFCGIAPLSNPRLVVLCVINEPHPVHWGAVVAAPVVRNIMQQALWYLNVPPDDPGQKAYVDPNAPKVAEVPASTQSASIKM